MVCCHEEEEFAKFLAPVWQVDNSAYSVSMTAVVKLPPELAVYAQDDDQLAAFSGDVCHGIGVKIDDLYYVAIQGATDEDATIWFSYYSARSQHLYTTDNLFPFEADGIFGTVDSPETLKLVVVKE
ncbi:hypothetical protein AGMMS50239_22710 [Bacteroidia bacterium]|nr:hypothetical protein AGMMS50239_22710 [Bacteroidia bacterium]